MTDTISFKHAGSPDREPYHYTACGLDNVYLTSGYLTREVGGERYVSVKEVEDLHKAIAMFLARQKKVLTGQEVRFVRKYLDLTQRELGAFLGVSDQSVARYEKGQSPLEGPTDALLRLLVVAQVGGCIDVREELETIRAADDATANDVTFELDDHHEWKVAA
jgi:putative zinc finger/helix-turn-helix YgiT family protein